MLLYCLSVSYLAIKVFFSWKECKRKRQVLEGLSDVLLTTSVDILSRDKTKSREMNHINPINYGIHDVLNRSGFFARANMYFTSQLNKRARFRLFLEKYL